MIDRAGPVNDQSSCLSILDLHTGDIDIQVLNLFLPGNIILPWMLMILNEEIQRQEIMAGAFCQR